MPEFEDWQGCCGITYIVGFPGEYDPARDSEVASTHVWLQAHTTNEPCNCEEGEEPEGLAFIYIAINALQESRLKKVIEANGFRLDRSGMNYNSGNKVYVYSKKMNRPEGWMSPMDFDSQEEERWDRGDY